jgi:integrase/recombinase XerD
MKTKKNELRESLKEEYIRHLVHQRGLAKKSVYKNWTYVVRFLDFRFGDNPDELSKITGGDINDLMHYVTGYVPPYRNKSVSTIMRGFCRFLFLSEKIETNLSLAIPRVSNKYAQRIPYHLTPSQVEELLEAVRHYSNPLCQKRNYAMVLLMARLGLRSQEVIAMQLDDIDWRNGEILIRGKGGFNDKAPLLKDIGESITDYICHERKGTCRDLFLASRSPYSPFKDAQILNTVLRQAFDKTDIPRPKQYEVSHILRHSLATNLVQKGASLEEISNTLRHRSKQTTLLYARQDINGLRTIALSWPLKKGGL